MSQVGWRRMALATQNGVQLKTYELFTGIPRRIVGLVPDHHNNHNKVSHMNFLVSQYI